MPHAKEYSILSQCADEVQRLTQLHESRQKLWMPSDLLSKKHVPSIGVEHAAVLVLNTLTEEGLPSFHRLLATYLGESPAWIAWTDLWTAEEDRHGAVLHDYVSRLSSIDMVAAERLQYYYLRQGFRPAWGGHPYRLVAYTVLQERATQMAHAGLATRVKSDDQVLARILGSIAGEEGKHSTFYRQVFAMLLERDPSGAMKSLGEVMRDFEMPGANIPGFDTLSYIAGRLEVFGAADYQKIVEETIWNLQIAEIKHLNESGAHWQRYILRLPRLLERAASKFSKMPARRVELATFPGWQATL